VDGPRRLGVDRDIARAAAPADGAAPAVEEDPADAVLGHQLGEADLRLVDAPAGRYVPDVLVRIGVPEHDLLLVADRPQRRPVDRRREQGAHRVGRVGQRLAGFEERHDAQHRVLAARPRKAILLHQEENLQQIGRVAGPRDDVALNRAGVEAGEQLVEQAEGRDDLPRRGGEAGDVSRNQRPSVGDLTFQECGPGVFVERLVVVLHAE
jgi:hypothetical protein